MTENKADLAKREAGGLSAPNPDFVRMMKAVRTELEENIEAREHVAKCLPASAALDELMRIMAMPRPGRPVPAAGPDGVLREAASLVLGELEEQRKGPKALYLIDERTGRTVCALPPGAIFQPPDYVGEDGMTHRAKPILHPALSSAIALGRTESWRRGSIIRRAEQDRTSQAAVRHLEGPEEIATLAASIAADAGLHVDTGTGEGPWTEIEFCKEHAGGVMQAMNPRFHRIHAFAKSLAKRVAEALKDGGRATIGEVREREAGGVKWYVALVQIRPLSQLPRIR